jgi:hypothetical protein
MYKTLSVFLKQAKNKQSAGLLAKLTKGFLTLRKEGMQKSKSFVTKTGRTFAVGDHRFEKLSERGTSSVRKNKYNET